MSFYDRLSELLTVREIMSPLGPTFDFSENAIDAHEIVMVKSCEDDYDPMDRLSLVTREGRPHGYLYLDSFVDLVESTTVGQRAEKIVTEQIISSDTPLLELPEFFAAVGSGQFLVLHRNKIVGACAWTDLSKVPFRLAIFSLALEIEERVLKKCSKTPQVSLDVLSDDRRRKAEEVFQKRYSHPPRANTDDRRLISCTEFSDRNRMFLKTHRDSLEDPKRAKSALHQTKELRNWCAHPSGSDGFDAHFKNSEEIYKSVNTMKYLLQILDGNEFGPDTLRQP